MKVHQAKRVPILTNTQIQLLRNIMEQENSSESINLELSLDLGISKTQITINPKNKTISIGENEIEIPKSLDETKELCYAVMDNQIYPMESYDQKTRMVYKLVPGTTKPYLIVSATRMHKEPFLKYLETQNLSGNVLDAGTGMGYSAIIAAKKGCSVVTVEMDQNVIYYQTFNPHSADLFDDDNIQLIKGDVTSIILEFEDEELDYIIHDGGTVKNSGTFFSQQHAFQLFRVLKEKGKLYFYLPNPQANKGRDFASEQINRLNKAGFKLLMRDEAGSFCVLTK